MASNELFMKVHIDTEELVKAIQDLKKVEPEQPQFEIAKLDNERQIVFGWASVSIQKDAAAPMVDRQNHMIDPVDLEDAAYVFNLQFRKTGEMHVADSVGEMIESFYVSPEKLAKMGLVNKSAPEYGWWVGFHIDNVSAFEKVKAGEYSMFSIQGKAIMEEVPSAE